MISLGFGEILGSILMGMSVDHFGPKKATLMVLVLVILQCLVVVLYIWLDYYSALAYFMTFMWGFQDGCLSIHVDAILGFEFESNSEPFSVDVLFESTCVFFF
jgi:predicted MFS family arabinose efflux permease